MLLWARIMAELEAHLLLAHEIAFANAAADDEATFTSPAGDADPAATAAEPAEETAQPALDEAKQKKVDELFEWLDLISSTRLPARIEDPDDPAYSNGEPRADQLVKELADLPEFVPRTEDDRQINEEFVRADDQSTLPGFNPQLSTRTTRTRTNANRGFFFDDSEHPCRCAHSYCIFRIVTHKKSYLLPGYA